MHSSRSTCHEITQIKRTQCILTPILKHNTVIVNSETQQESLRVHNQTHNPIMQKKKKNKHGDPTILTIRVYHKKNPKKYTYGNKTEHNGYDMLKTLQISKHTQY